VTNASGRHTLDTLHSITFCILICVGIILDNKDNTK